MKSIIILFLFGSCMCGFRVEEKIECVCDLRLTTGHLLATSKLSAQSLQLSTKCDREDFFQCADGCKQKTSNETNGFDLSQPMIDSETELSLGQQYCNQIKADVSDAKVLLSVTLNCDIEREIKVERNGTVVSLGTTSALSSVTRLLESGFKQSLKCVDNKYISNSNDSKE